ncbi:hypothetical protein M8C21_008942 [Ambrosia artemisiifolia]|uniref:Uncharacterized protein n=1 Tax=Ambrosia artemisiifolia TaxID=4212 RepID=A0AAD5CF92_AMBAR|nr:hypothetical protein M8C21_008942 [Ambrosia artemisiifolia]
MMAILNVVVAFAWLGVIKDVVVVSDLSQKRVYKVVAKPVVELDMEMIQDLLDPTNDNLCIMEDPKDKQTGTYNTQQYEEQISALKTVDPDEEFFPNIERRRALEQAYMPAGNDMWNNTRYATEADMDLLLKTLTPTFFSESGIRMFSD